MSSVSNACSWCFTPINSGSCECCSRTACDVCCEDFICIGGMMDVCQECFDAGCGQCRIVVQCPVKTKINMFKHLKD